MSDESRTPQEADDLTATYFSSLEASGWTPPSTIGGKWCRVSPEGVYEFWPSASAGMAGPEPVMPRAHSSACVLSSDHFGFCFDDVAE